MPAGQLEMSYRIEERIAIEADITILIQATQSRRPATWGAAIDVPL